MPTSSVGSGSGAVGVVEGELDLGLRAGAAAVAAGEDHVLHRRAPQAGRRSARRAPTRRRRTRLLLPLPLGPMTTPTPGSKTSSVCRGNDLKPRRRSRLRYTLSPPRRPARVAGLGVARRQRPMRHRAGVGDLVRRPAASAGVRRRRIGVGVGDLTGCHASPPGCHARLAGASTPRLPQRRRPVSLIGSPPAAQARAPRLRRARAPAPRSASSAASCSARFLLVPTPWPRTSPSTAASISNSR